MSAFPTGERDFKCLLLILDREHGTGAGYFRTSWRCTRRNRLNDTLNETGHR